MQPTHSLTVISLGGGVQSSVMALMASQGAFDAIPDCAIFADTHWEPPGLYTRLDWLAERLGFPVYVVDNGRSLREDVNTLTNHSGNHSFVDLPLYLKGRNGHGDGIGRRQCTEHYKIRRAPRSAWVERFGFGTRPGVGRWLGEQAWGPEAEPCLKPPRQLWSRKELPTEASNVEPPAHGRARVESLEPLSALYRGSPVRTETPNSNQPASPDGERGSEPSQA